MAVPHTFFLKLFFALAIDSLLHNFVSLSCFSVKERIGGQLLCTVIKICFC